MSMKLPEQDYLISLLSAVINNTQPQNPPEALDWDALYRLSDRHRISNMVWYGIMDMNPENKPPNDILLKFKKDYRIGLAKEAAQYIAAAEIVKAFEEHQIACLPLKGCIVKYLYPRPDMRQMSDIDILVKPGQTERAKELMLDMSFTAKSLGGNHDIYYREPFINVEIHRRLISENSPYSSYLSTTWDRAKLNKGYQYTYKLSDEDFFIYLIIHLTKHYSGSGTGIRSFIDICLYNRRYSKSMDWDYIWTELTKTGLREFAQSIAGLCGVWFEGAQSNGIYKDMAGYILKSGVYGTRRQSVISSMSFRLKLKSDTKYSIRIIKLRYVLKLFFPPVNTMKILYPRLGRAPFLLPVSWVLRGIRCVLFKSRHTFDLLRQIRSVSGDSIRKTENMYIKTGLIK